jgi:hypothetical protein
MTSKAEKFLKLVLPAPLLDTLCLPRERLELIKPVLEQLGLSCEEGQIEPEDSDEIFHFTLVRNGVCRALLFLEDENLSFYSRENKLALEEVRDAFQGKHPVLYVFHNQIPHATYKNLMEGQWFEKYTIRAKFIPLSQLDDFENMTIEQ